jgi:hypothetical protein
MYILILSVFLFLVINMALDLLSLICILLSFAQILILARSEFAKASASDGVFPFVKTARSSAKAFVWLEKLSPRGHHT